MLQKLQRYLKSNPHRLQVKKNDRRERVDNETANEMGHEDKLEKALDPAGYLPPS